MKKKAKKKLGALPKAPAKNEFTLENLLKLLSNIQPAQFYHHGLTGTLELLLGPNPTSLYGMVIKEDKKLPLGEVCIVAPNGKLLAAKHFFHHG